MANLKSWEEASSSSQYKSASPENQAKMKEQFRAAGGFIPGDKPSVSDTSDWAKDVSSFLSSAGSAGAQSIGNRIQQAGLGIQEALAPAVNYVMGNQEYTQNDVSRIQDAQAKTKSDYSKRMDSLSSQAGRKTGEFIGHAGTDIAAMVAAPQTAPAILGLVEGGRAYSDQKPEEKSIARAAQVGGANYIANKLIPVSGGTTAKDLVKRVGAGAGVGAIGGGLVGVAEEVNANPESSTEDRVAAGLRNAGYGAAFGGTVGGIHAGIDFARAPKSSPINPTQPTSRELDSSLVSEANASGDSAAIRSAYDQSPDINTANALKVLDDNGFRISDAVARNDESAQRLLNTNQRNAESAFVDAENSNAPVGIFGRPTERQGKAYADAEHNQKQAVSLLDTLRTNRKDNVASLDNWIQARERDLQDLKGAGDFAGNPADLDAALRADKDFISAYKKFSTDSNKMDARTGEAQSMYLDSAQQLNDLSKNISEGLRGVVDNFSTIKGMPQGFNPIREANINNKISTLMDNQDRGWKTLTSQGLNETAAPSITTNPVGLLKYGYRRLKSNFDINQRAKQQETNAQSIRALAQADLSVSRARAKADEAKAAIEQNNDNPIPFKTSEDVVQTPEVDASVNVAPEAPVRDIGFITRQAGTSTRLQERAARNAADAALAREQALAREAEANQPAPVEAPVRDEDFLRRQAASRGYLDRNRPIEEPVPEQVVEPVIQVDETPRGISAQELADIGRRVRESRKEEPAVEEPIAVDEIPRGVSAQELADIGRRVRESKPTEEPIPEPIIETPVIDEPPRGVSAQELAEISQRVRAMREAAEPTPEPIVEVAPEASVEAPRPSPDQGVVRQPSRPEAPVEAPTEPTLSQRRELSDRNDPRAFDETLTRQEADAILSEPVPEPVAVDETPRGFNSRELADVGQRVREANANRVVEETPQPVVEESAVEAPVDRVSSSDLADSGRKVRESRKEEPTEDVVEEAVVDSPSDVVESSPQPSEPKSIPLPARTPEPRSEASRGLPEGVKNREGIEKLASMPPAVRQATQSKLDRFIRTLSSPIVKAKATLEDIYGSSLSPREYMKRLTAEDNSINVEKQEVAAKRQLDSLNGLAKAKDTIIRNQFDEWAKARGLPEGIARDALKALEKGEGGNVSSLDALKGRAERMYDKKKQADFNREYEAALKEDKIRNPDEVGPSISEQKDLFNTEMESMLKGELMSPAQKSALRDLMKSHVDDKFKSYEKAGRVDGLETGQMSDLWGQFYNEYKKQSNVFLKANKEGQYKMAADAITAREKALQEALTKRQAQLAARSKRDADVLTTKAIAAQRSEIEKLLNALPDGIKESTSKLITRQMNSHHDQGSPMAPEKYRNMIERIGNDEHRFLERQSRLSQEERELAEEKYNKAYDSALEMNRRFDVETRSKAIKEEEAKQKKENDYIAVQRQRDDISSRLIKALEDRGIVGKDAESFVGSYMDNRYSLLDEPLTRVGHQNARSRIESDVEKFAKAYEGATSSEKAIQVLSGGDESSLANKGSEMDKALKEARDAEADVNKLVEEDQAIQKARDALPSDEKADISAFVKEARERSVDDFVSKVEKAFKDSKSLDELANVAEVLDRVHGGDSAGNNRRFIDVLRTAATNREKYGDVPAAWISSEDYSAIAKLGRGSAGGNKTRALEKIFGTTAEDAKRKLLGPEEVKVLRKIIETNPETKIPKFENASSARQFIEGFDDAGVAKKRGALLSRKLSSGKTLRVRPKNN